MQRNAYGDHDSLRGHYGDHRGNLHPVRVTDMQRLTIAGTALLLLAALPLCPQTAVYPGAAATDAQLGVAANFIDTTLLAPVKTTDTRIFLRNPARVVSNLLLTVDNEIMQVCNVAANIAYIGHSSCPNIDGRGFDSTTATTHALNAQVTANIDAWHHNSLKAEVEALERNQSGGGSYTLPTATNAVLGGVTMSTATSGVAVATDDSRNANSRTPTGSASGDLGSNYPAPTVIATHLTAPLPVNQGGTGATSIPTWNQSTSGNAATATNGVTATSNITNLYSVIGDGGAKGVKVGPAI